MTKETFGIIFVILCVIFVLSSCSADDPAPIKSIVAAEKTIKEEPKEEPKPNPAAEPKEEKFVPYKEKVCVVINGKEKCRVITKHKKHEGTKIKK
jgi:PBP1b-binding outer membrane lipoprotein LpoB